jgi:hypothetical protein
VKRLLHAIRTVISSRALSPLVIGFFLLLYIGIAFFTNDTLTALMEFTRSSVFLTAILALLPLNSAARIVTETGSYFRRRRVLAGDAVEVPPGLFDEMVEIAASPAIAALESRLATEGYKSRRSENALAAWRGGSIFSARILYLIGAFCLFAGILISLTGRTSFRNAVIEGEPFFTSAGGGTVERIVLGDSSGPILSKSLSIEVAPSNSGAGRRSFGLYPPSLYGGAFVYPRYLGIALFLRFSAPDLPAGFEKHTVLSIYPPGKEASLEIPDSPYRIVLGMAEPDDGSDPYITGRMVFLFKLVKGKEVLFTGSVPAGGEFVRDGYLLAFPDSRRLVITDFIQDYGVLLIWTAAVLLVAAGCIWLPVRFLSPRREMLFSFRPDKVHAFSRAEGKRRRHEGIFHETLDFLEARRGDRQPVAR